VSDHPDPDPDPDPSATLTAIAEAQFDGAVAAAETVAREGRSIAEQQYGAGAAGADISYSRRVIDEVLLLERLIRRARIAREHGDPLHRLRRELEAATSAVLDAIAAPNAVP
jgi:hypothetical protein